MIWSGPYQILLAVIMLWGTLGPAFWAGVGVIGALETRPPRSHSLSHHNRSHGADFTAITLRNTPPPPFQKS